jgi:hypothetical protein
MKSFHHFLILSLISNWIFLVLSLHAQDSIYIDWLRNFEGPEINSFPIDIVKDNHDNFYVTGESHISLTDSYIATVKYDSSGNEQWVALYENATYRDYMRNMAVDDHGSIYLAFVSLDSSTFLKTKFIKYDSMGSLIWEKLNTSLSFPREIFIDDSGNIYISDVGFRLVKYDSLGNKSWFREYHNPTSGLRQMNAMTMDDSGYIYLTGPCEGPQPQFDAVTIKYNSDGDSLWVARYSNSNGWPYDVAVDKRGNVYVTGDKDIGSIRNIFLIKYDRYGVQQWLSTYGATGRDNSRLVAVDDEGNVYVGGLDPNGNDFDIATFKFDSTGAFQWVRRFNGPANGWDSPVDMVIDPKGGVIITGSVWKTASQTDMVILKYNSNGDLEWSDMYGNQYGQEDYPVAILLDKKNNILLAGASEIGNGIRAYTTIKYKRTSVVSTGSPKPPVIKKFSFAQNYPNPFNPNTTIEYYLPFPTKVTLTIYNVIGERVAILVNDEKQSGLNKIKWNAGNLTSGIYYYEIKSKNFRRAKRMVLLK